MKNWKISKALASIAFPRFQTDDINLKRWQLPYIRTVYIDTLTQVQMTKSIISMFFLLVLTSCSHYYYVPTPQNVPLFREKNECRATIAISGIEEYFTTDIQAAYSITDKFAVTSNFMMAEGGDLLSDNRGEGKYFDAAFGYFKPLSLHSVFEIYGGVGTCNQHHKYQLTSSSFWDSRPPKYYRGTADVSFTKIFLQPSLGITHDAFDIALTTGISVITINKINNQIDPGNPEYSYLNTMSQNRNFFLFEPSLTIRGGWKHFKLQLQLMSSKNIFNTNLKLKDSKVSIGLTFAFAKKSSKKIAATPPGQ